MARKSYMARLAEPIDVERYVNELLTIDMKGIPTAFAAKLLDDIALAEETGKPVKWGRASLRGRTHTYGRK